LAYISAMSDTAKPCPICAKPSQPSYQPFCSKRCADVDLHRWLSGRYAVPAVESDDDEDDPPPRRDGDA
jgi:uncharacterized protein